MSDELVFLPLGGSGEIGMNMNLFALGPPEDRKWIIVDLGVTFAGDDIPGVDLITPDHNYILDEMDEDAELLGLIATHGHEDHIGAIAHLWPDLGCDIYATPFTAELIRRKFAETGIKDVPIKIIDLEARFELGPFDLEFVTLTHSIPEPNAIILRTRFGTVLHTGDWKIDPRPVLGKPTNEEKLTGLGDDGVLAMICDSTNVFSEGRSGSESDVAETLEQIIGDQPNRVCVTTFASNVSRLVSVCVAAKKADRSVCLLGRSMLRMIEVAQMVDLIPPGVSFVEPKEAGYLPKDKILYLCTGSQGEERAALSRIAREDHPELSLSEGDTVIFSSKMIPGNERGIFELVNQLTDLGCTIVTEEDAFVHVSGHPCRDELRDMYGWVRPEIAIPVHGEARHLVEHAALAKELGTKAQIVPKNGDLIRIAPDGPKRLDEVPAGRINIDGKVLLPQGDGVIRARRRLAEEGIIVVSVAYDGKNKMLGAPQVLIKGVPKEDNEGDDLPGLIEDAAMSALDKLAKPKRGSDRDVEGAVRRGIRAVTMPRWGKRSDIVVQVLRG